MYNKTAHKKTSIRASKPPIQGEPISRKVARISQNKEPIKDGAPIIYQEREDGIQAEYDIRTDRFEVAVEAMDKKHNYNFGKREERLQEKARKKADQNNTKPTETNNNKQDATTGGGENPPA